MSVADRSGGIGEDGAIDDRARCPLRQGLRGRFGMYMPPLLEALGLAELEHNPRNNRMRGI